MSEEIRVYVVKYTGKKSLYMRYRDPITGKHIARSTGEARRKEADRVAAKWEAELREGRYASPLKTTWAELIDKYSLEYLAGLSKGTNAKVECLFSVVEEFMKPGKLRLAKLDARWVSKLRSELRKNGRAETTIDGHCRHLKAMLRWGKSQGMLTEVPHIDMSKRAKGAKAMKGRPITKEEFERMLAKVESVAGESAAASWDYFIRGLWWSGLRLAESLTLSWDEHADGLRVDTSEKYVTMVIPGDHEKGGKDRVYPVAPEFAEILLAVPESDREGFVFNPQPLRALRNQKRVTEAVASRVVGKFGEAANVVVDKKKDKTTYASAHDLRRSFGLRWSRRVMPPVLQELMRHESIQTTMKFYVGQDAQSTAAELHRAFSQVDSKSGNLLGNPVEK